MALPLETRLAEVWPPERWKDVGVILAVSGGADSVALLRAVVAVRQAGAGRVWVAHFNHRLRGDEAETDEQFVVDLCGRLGIGCEVGRRTRQLSLRKEGVEAAARKLRYRFLRETAGRLGARYVVTAHTADDQAETILHRIVRGTGVRGLAGTAAARPLLPGITLLRPLLSVRRGQILSYLESLGQAFCRDASNDDRRFTRNRIRQELLPWLAEEFNPGVVDALLRLGSLAGEAQAVVEATAADLQAQYVHFRGDGSVQVLRRGLQRQPPFLLREMFLMVWRHQGWPLREMGLSEWERLAEMVQGASGSTRRMLPGGVTAAADGDMLILRPPCSTSAGEP